jgi:hypothetical protein
MIKSANIVPVRTAEFMVVCCENIDHVNVDKCALKETSPANICYWRSIF